MPLVEFPPQHPEPTEQFDAHQATMKSLAEIHDEYLAKQQDVLAVGAAAHYYMNQASANPELLRQPLFDALMTAMTTHPCATREQVRESINELCVDASCLAIKDALLSELAKTHEVPAEHVLDEIEEAAA